MNRMLTMVIGLSVLVATTTHAEVTTTFNFMEWRVLIGEYTTIDFTGLPDGTSVSNQYTSLGVSFTGPSFIAATTGFVNDGWGLHCPSGAYLFFDDPQQWLAIHHAGNALFKLYFEGKLVGISGFDSIGGIGSFTGIVSDVPFNEVIITKPPSFGTHIFVDDLHWGAPIPAPGALGLLALGALMGLRRSRT